MNWKDLVAAICLSMSWSKGVVRGNRVIKNCARPIYSYSQCRSGRNGRRRFHRRRKPNGITLLDRSQPPVAGEAMLPDINFDRNPQTKVPGGGGDGNAGVFFPIGSVFMSTNSRTVGRHRTRFKSWTGLGLRLELGGGTT